MNVATSNYSNTPKRSNNSNDSNHNETTSTSNADKVADKVADKHSDEVDDDRYTVDSNGTMHFRELKMKCTHCSNVYSKTHDLYQHIRSHQNHTQCPFCNKVLTCMATFVYHVRTHTGEKPYYCPVKGCDFENAVKYNLKVHLASMRHGYDINITPQKNSSTKILTKLVLFCFFLFCFFFDQFN